jgi:hypothetical protein
LYCLAAYIKEMMFLWLNWISNYWLLKSSFVHGKNWVIYFVLILKKMELSYEITLLSVCIPLSLLGNGLVDTLPL